MSKISIEKIDGNNVYYKCECGIFGQFLFRPLSFIGESIVSVQCPSCSAEERVILKEKGQVFNENTFYSFSVILNNKIIKMNK